MPIRITVHFNDKEKAKKLGAWWFPDEKTWVIPDDIEDINPFIQWMSNTDNFIIKKPHILAKSKRICWKCNAETPLIAICANNFFVRKHNVSDQLCWQREHEPVVFSEISSLDKAAAELLQNLYPFFKPTFSYTTRTKYWANNCVRCGALQGDNYNLLEPGGPFFPLSESEAQELCVEDLKLKFDYSLQSGINRSEVYDWFLK